MAFRIVLSLTRSTPAASRIVSKPGEGPDATGEGGNRSSGPTLADIAPGGEAGESPTARVAARLLRRLEYDWGVVRLMIGNEKTDQKRGDACGLFVTCTPVYSIGRAVKRPEPILRRRGPLSGWRAAESCRPTAVLVSLLIARDRRLATGARSKRGTSVVDVTFSPRSRSISAE